MGLDFETRTFSDLEVVEDGQTYREFQYYRFVPGDGNVQPNGKIINSIVDASLLLPPYNAWSLDFPGFRVQSAKLNRTPEGGDGLIIEIQAKRTLKSDEDGDDEQDEESPSGLRPIEPWRRGIKNYQTSPVFVQDTVKNITKEDGTTAPLQTTAGTEIIAEYQRPQLRISFQKDIHSFSSGDIISYVGKVNNDTVTIKNRTYQKGYLKIDSISASDMQENNDDGSVKWNYARVSFELLFDPKTFFIDYLNASTYFKPNNGKLSQIWTGNDGTEQKFGTKKEMFEQLTTDVTRETIEPVSEPLFLNEADGEIAPFSTEGKQIATHVTGCPYELIDMADWFADILSTEA